MSERRFTPAEEDQPTEILHSKGETQCRQNWRDNQGRLHRENDLPARVTLQDGRILREEWCQEGCFSRENGLPVDIIHYSDGKHTEIWRDGRGQTYRENGLPTMVDCRANGDVAEETWRSGEQGYCRENSLPTGVSYHENGNVAQEIWGSGKYRLHRGGDLPAKIHYDEDGNKIREEWYQKNKKHRENDLPAKIHYDEDGSISEECWFTRGRWFRRGKKPNSVIYMQSGEILMETRHNNRKTRQSKKESV